MFGTRTILSDARFLRTNSGECEAGDRVSTEEIVKLIKTNKILQNPNNRAELLSVIRQFIKFKSAQTL